MTRENPREKLTFDFIRVNGTGTVATDKGYYDVFVFGYFTCWRWSFIVHQAVEDPELVTVSEASTGYRLRDENYYTIEDALHYALPFIREKHLYFGTLVGHTLVLTKTNLLKRNTTNLQTIAIDSALWF